MPLLFAIVVVLLFGIFLWRAQIAIAGKIIVLACMLAGGFIGYILGVEVACGVFDMGNLCGLVGIFITGPLGLIAGGVAGYLIVRRRFATQ